MKMTMRWLLILGLAGPLGCDGCGAGCGESESDEETAAEQTGAGESQATEEAEKDAGPDPEAEACARLVLVSWEGAEGGPEGIERSKDEARGRIEEVKKKLEGGEPGPIVAYEHSDHKSRTHSGVIGTFPYGRWPIQWTNIRTEVFGLEVGETSEILETDKGFVIVQRCPLEGVHTRFLLIRHRGAKGASPKIRRSEEDAQKLAEELRQRVLDGEDIAELARKHSDDPASADKGGYIGENQPGMIVPEAEATAFSLEMGEVSEVVETDYGYMVMKRIPPPDSEEGPSGKDPPQPPR